MSGMSSCTKDNQGHPNHKKIDRSVITKPIEKYNQSISHYLREHAPNRRYLPSDITVQGMYEDFKTTSRALSCSDDLYRKVLNELNISFTKLGHEECGECGIFHEHNKEHSKDNTDSVCKISVYSKTTCTK